MGVRTGKQLGQMTQADWEAARREESDRYAAADDGAAVERGRYDPATVRFQDARTGRCDYVAEDNTLCWNEATKIHPRSLGTVHVCDEHYALLHPER